MRRTRSTSLLATFGLIAGIASAGAQSVGLNNQQTPPQNRLMIYAQPSYHGRSLSLGRRTVDLGLVNMGDDVGSFIIQEGSWQMCTLPDFMGACRVFSHSERDLRRVGFNDRIRSVQRLD